MKFEKDDELRNLEGRMSGGDQRETSGEMPPEGTLRHNEMDERGNDTHTPTHGLNVKKGGEGREKRTEEINSKGKEE